MIQREDKHHDGLPGRELRRVIAIAERNNSTSQGIYNSPPDGSGNHEYFYNHLLAQRAKAIKAVEDYEAGRGYGQVLNQFGWSVFDISDQIEFNDAYTSFVGTYEELKERFPNYEGPA